MSETWRTTVVNVEMTDPMESCAICLLEKEKSEFFTLRSCSHEFCFSCLSQFALISTNQSSIEIPCPMPRCEYIIHPNDIAILLPSETLSRWETFQIRKALLPDPNVRWCPESTCLYAIIADNCQECPKLTCGSSDCGCEFCYNCKDKWHEGTNCAITNSPISGFESEIKPCPTCKVQISKNDGCNFMTCKICGCQFCWICGKETDSLFHFTGRSGCPYYGQRAKTTRQKIALQIIFCLLAIPGIPLFSVGLGIAAIVVVPYWLAKICCDLISRPYLRYTAYALLYIVCLPMGLFTGPIVTVLTFFVSVVVVFVMLPMFWFVDLRQYDASRYQKSVIVRRTQPEIVT